MPSALLLFGMAAIDFIIDRKTKKLKYYDMTWQINAAGLLEMGLSLESLQPVGLPDWNKSRYLSVGREMYFYAHIGGTYYVLMEKLRVGYVEPKFGSFGPAYDESQEDNE